MKALIFDLDGTLVDTVYGHTLSWQWALAESGIDADSARLHRRIGMAGGLLMEETAREAAKDLSDAEMKIAEKRHAELFAQLVPKPRPLAGAVLLLEKLRQASIPFGIATSGKRESIEPAILALGLPEGSIIVDGSTANQAKPEPDLFIQCQARLVGDATWIS
jgi:beta-phosphoglucomutase-like phosphatase (HAD superfamily)